MSGTHYYIDNIDSINGLSCLVIFVTLFSLLLSLIFCLYGKSKKHFWKTLKDIALFYLLIVFFSFIILYFIPDYS